MKETRRKIDHRETVDVEMKKKIRSAQRGREKRSECDRLCPEDAVVFILLPAYAVISSPPPTHTHGGSSTCLYLSLPPLYILYHSSSLLRGRTAVLKRPF